MSIPTGSSLPRVRCVQPRCTDITSMLRTSLSTDSSFARPRLWLSLMGLMLVMVVVTSRSKSRQKVVKKWKKPQRSEKFAKAIGSEERLPKHRSFVKKLELPLKLFLTVFRALFAGPRSSLDTTFGAITDKAKLVELLKLCRVFPQRSQEDLRVDNSRVFHQL